MQRASDLNLPLLEISTPEFAKDPFSQFNRARAAHPWLAKTDIGGYIVTEYTAIRDFLLMDAKLRPPLDFVISHMGAEGTHWAKFQRENLLGLVGEPHDRIRKVVAAAFTPRAANRARGIMREVISDLLDQWAPKGRFDFEEFASLFPITVMCRLIGAPVEDVPAVRASLEALGLSMCMDPKFLPELEKATLFMETYLDGLVAKRRAAKRTDAAPDLLDELIAMHDAGGFSDQELTSLLIFLYVGGYDTSKNELTMIMHELLKRPDIYARCAEDIAYCHKVVEEGLRFEAPGTSARLTDEEIVYRDVVLPKDTMLFLPNGISGRDPSAAANPDVFDPERPEAARHMAFGRGMHMCLGQYLARAQIEEGLHQIAQRITHPKLAGAVAFRPFPGVWGLKGLPIEFTPAPPRALEAAE